MKPLKSKAHEWIISFFEQHYIECDGKVKSDLSFRFMLEGFADEPEVYIQSTASGIEFGYDAIQWDGYMDPFPVMVKKHLLTWETLKSLSKEEQQEAMLELILKTINSRKRQYRKCQFCGEKVANEHRYDKNTCHGCASKHYGVVY